MAADDARIYSPLYGPTAPRTFYPNHFADTSAAELTLLAPMRGYDHESGAAVVSFYFHFDWRLPSGAAAPFDVVDVARLAPDGRTGYGSLQMPGNSLKGASRVPQSIHPLMGGVDGGVARPVLVMRPRASWSAAPSWSAALRPA